MPHSTARPHFLISRTDNIGDVILTLPLAAALKSQQPKCKITMLVKGVLKPIVESHPAVDDYLDWTRLQEASRPEQESQLRSLGCDSILHVFPNPQLAWLAKRAKIPQRIGTSRRWYHWFTCTHRVPLSRAGSKQHEAQLNIQLIRALEGRSDYSLDELRPLTEFRKVSQEELPEALKEVPWKDGRFNLVLHPFSRGSAREWPVECFRTLANQCADRGMRVIFTGSKEEACAIKEELTPHCKDALDMSGKLGLGELVALIKQADGLVAASTGPLHIAAAGGIPTLGLFPNKVGMTPQRWGPLGAQAHAITSPIQCKKSCDNHRSCSCMKGITVSKVLAAVETWHQKHKNQSVC